MFILDYLFWSAKTILFGTVIMNVVDYGLFILKNTFIVINRSHHSSERCLPALFWSNSPPNRGSTFCSRVQDICFKRTEMMQTQHAT